MEAAWNNHSTALLEKLPRFHAKMHLDDEVSRRYIANAADAGGG